MHPDIIAGDNSKGGISLCLIDEVHGVGEGMRGAVLESIIARIMTHASKDCRLVAVSATIGNPKVIAKWLRDAQCFSFPAEWRPVPLQISIQCTPMNGRNPAAYEHSLNTQLPGILERFCAAGSDKQENNDEKMHYYFKKKARQNALHDFVLWLPPTLVFCSTRRSVVETARFLENALLPKKEAREGTATSAAVAVVGMHHGGLSVPERAKVEQAFKEGRIKVLCCTSTLAVGVNLPARMVILKGTMHYNGRGYTECSDSELMQMIGRAGRPQFDTSATAVILCDPSQHTRLSTLTTGQLSIECSQLGRGDHLLDCLNAENCIEWHFFTSNLNPKSGVWEWFRNTLYWHVTLQKKAEGALTEAFARLQACGLVDQAQKITAMGTCAARSYIGVKTVEGFVEANELLSSENTCHRQGLCDEDAEVAGELLRVITQSAEFADSRYIPGDKGLLVSVVKDPRLPFRHHWDTDGVSRANIPGRLKEPWHRTSLLIQAVLAGVSLPSCALTQEATWMVERAARIARCLVEYLVVNSSNVGKEQWNKKKLFSSPRVAILSAFRLMATLNARHWPGSRYQVEQVPGVGQAYAQLLNRANIRALKELRESDPRRLEVILGRHAPFGSQLLTKLQETIPQVATLTVTTSQNTSGYSVSFAVQQPTDKLKGRVTLLAFSLGQNNNGNFIYRRTWPLKGFSSGFLQTKEPLQSVHVLFDQYVGVEEEWPKGTNNTSSKKHTETAILLPIRIIDEGEEDDSWLKDLHLPESFPTSPPKFRQAKPLTFKPTNLSQKRPISSPLANCAHLCGDKKSCKHARCKDRRTKKGGCDNNHVVSIVGNIVEEKQDEPAGQQARNTIPSPATSSSTPTFSSHTNQSSSKKKLAINQATDPLGSKSNQRQPPSLHSLPTHGDCQKKQEWQQWLDQYRLQPTFATNRNEDIVFIRKPAVLPEYTVVEMYMAIKKLIFLRIRFFICLNFFLCLTID